MLQLRVKEVERTVIHVPFRPRSAPWNELLVGQFGVVEICRITTDSSDLVGYGETLLHYTWERVSDASVARVVGQNAADHLWDDTLGAGLQMALLDLVAKALGVPAHQLLGRQIRDWCPIAWWSTKMPPEVLAAEAADAYAEGYLAHKFKARPWFDVYEQVDAVAAVTPPTYRLDPDWNAMLLDVDEATSVLATLDEEDRIGLFETPIPSRDIAGYRTLRARVRHALADHFDRKLFPTITREDALDAFVVQDDGISAFLRDGQACAGMNKNLFLQIVGTGLTTALTMHLGAVLTHARWPAVTALNIYADDLLENPIEIHGGFARVPEAAGLGVTVDEEAIRRLQMEPLENRPEIDDHARRPFDPVLHGALDSPYQVLYPRKLLSFALGDGRVRHYAGIDQLWLDCEQNGTMPRQQRGARLHVRTDDGTRDFDDLYRRAAAAPVWSDQL